MNELIQTLTDYVYNHADLPEDILTSTTIYIGNEFLEYWVEGTCRVSFICSVTEDEGNWTEYRLSFTIDTLDAKDADGEWHELPKSQVRELQMELNKSI